jgi:hypothetical protein
LLEKWLFKFSHLGHLGSWAPGLLGSWAPGILDPWAPGYLRSWALGLLGSWTPGHLGIYALGHPAYKAPGHLGAWAPTLLGTQPLGHLGTWALWVLGFLGSWDLGPLGTYALRHLASWAPGLRQYNILIKNFRWVMVYLPRKSERIFTRRNSKIFIAICWILPILCILPSLTQAWGRHALDCKTRSCTIKDDENGRLPFKKFVLTVGVTVPTLILIVANAMIYAKVSKIKIITFFAAQVFE